MGYRMSRVVVVVVWAMSMSRVVVVVVWAMSIFLAVPIILTKVITHPHHLIISMFHHVVLSL